MPERKTQKKATKSTKPTSTPVKSSQRPKNVSTTSKPVVSQSVKKKEMSSESSKPAFRIKRSYIVTLLAVLLIVTAIFLGRNYLVAAMVNGQPISRLSVISDLEKQGGKQALDTIITKTLIAQEAKKRNITVSQKDIDAELKRLETTYAQQGQKLDQVLSMNGMTKNQLVELVETQKKVEKMLGNTQVTDKEIDDYIEKNRSSLPQDQDEKTLKANIKDRLHQQKLNEKAQTFLETLRKNAKIDYYVQY